MSRQVSSGESGRDQSDQDNFYSASVEWVKSLRDRHDPEHRFIGILDNDTERYTYQAVSVSIIPAYQPPAEVAGNARERTEFAQNLTDLLKVKAEAALGPDVFDGYLEDLTTLSEPGGQPGDVLKSMYRQLDSPGQNTSIVGFHPNIMALPFYSEMLPVALMRLGVFNDKADIFEFCQRNLMPVNPALGVASFGGVPVFEAIPFTTLLKMVPPTRSALQYGMSRDLQRKMISQSKESLESYLGGWYAAGKSVNLTTDPTASTFESVYVEGRLDHLRRIPVNRGVKRMVLDDFNSALPITMKIDKARGSDWHIGQPIHLEGENADEAFDEMVNELDKATERLYGTDMKVAFPERSLGKQAISSPAV